MDHRPMRVPLVELGENNIYPLVVNSEAYKCTLSKCLIVFGFVCSDSRKLSSISPHYRQQPTQRLTHSRFARAEGTCTYSHVLMQS